MQLFGFFEHLKCWGCTYRRPKQSLRQRQTMSAMVNYYQPVIG